jgi:uncharacterized protein YkwD
VPATVRFSRSLLSATVTALMTVAAVLPALPQPVAARGGATFVDLANEHRSELGVRGLRLNAVIDGIAVDRADQMARAMQLNHDLEFIGRRLSRANICFERIGEIVAYHGATEGRIRHFVNQWYRSDAHRAIMLSSSYTRAAGSYTTASNGLSYGVMIFVRLCG